MSRRRDEREALRRALDPGAEDAARVRARLEASLGLGGGRRADGSPAGDGGPDGAAPAGPGAPGGGAPSSVPGLGASLGAGRWLLGLLVVGAGVAAPLWLSGPGPAATPGGPARGAEERAAAVSVQAARAARSADGAVAPASGVPDTAAANGVEPGPGATPRGRAPGREAARRPDEVTDVGAGAEPRAQGVARGPDDAASPRPRGPVPPPGAGRAGPSRGRDAPVAPTAEAPASGRLGAPSTGGGATAGAGPVDPVALEAARLREAHRALQAGRPGDALALLDAPAGPEQLRPERLTLRAMALCALGRRQAAGPVIDTLAALDPQAPALRRAQAACAAR